MEPCHCWRRLPVGEMSARPEKGHNLHLATVFQRREEFIYTQGASAVTRAEFQETSEEYEEYSSSMNKLHCL